MSSDLPALGALVLAASLAACVSPSASPAPEATPLGAWGGSLPDGRHVELQLVRGSAGVFAAGRVGNEAASFVQHGGQRIAGELRLTSGELIPVFLDLAPGPTAAIVTETGSATLQAMPAGVADLDTSNNAFSGHYRASDARAAPVEALWLQGAQANVWGQARSWGRDALVAAWVQVDGSLRGDLIFDDSTSFEFRAWPTSDGDLELDLGGGRFLLEEVNP